MFRSVVNLPKSSGYQFTDNARLRELVELEKDRTKAKSRRKPQPMLVEPIAFGDLIRERSCLMSIDTTCPVCHEMIADRAMKIEPVWAGRVALYDYSCPSCGIFLFVDADGALSDDAIAGRINRHRQEITESYRGRPTR